MLYEIRLYREVIIHGAARLQVVHTDTMETNETSSIIRAKMARAQVSHVRPTNLLMTVREATFQSSV